MAEGYNLYNLNHTATAERVVNSQIEELKSDIAYLILEMEKVSHLPSELSFTTDRIEELNYQIIKLKAQLDKLTKEEEDI